MFGLNFKRKKAALPPPEATAVPTTYSDVYVMPEKYIVQSAKGGSKGLIIASVILVAVILVTGGYLLYDAYSRPQAAPAPTPTAPVVEVPTEQPPVETPPPVEQSPVTIPTTSPEIPPGQPISPATTTPPAPTTPPAISLDSDNDGLTDVEEELLGTLPTNSDTDGDGYLDGVEVANGYNPTKAGSSFLSESPFIASLTTSFASDNFQILYPKEWQASQMADTKQVLLTAATGEMIRISVKNNEQGLSVLAWYLQEHPEAAVSQLKIITSGSLSGIYSPDGFTAWMTDGAKTKFYVFEYLTGRQTEFRYPAIFNLIIKSLKPVISAPPDEVTY